MLSQDGNIFAGARAMAALDRDDVQAIKEVARRCLLDLSVEPFVSRGRTRTSSARSFAADRRTFDPPPFARPPLPPPPPPTTPPLNQNTQDRGLHLGAHVRNLVQKQSRAIGQLKLNSCAGRSRERSFM